MSEYTDRIFAKMDKIIKDKPMEIVKQIKRYCKNFEKCECGFCINYIGTRKRYFQNCVDKCKERDFTIRVGGDTIKGHEIKY